MTEQGVCSPRTVVSSRRSVTSVTEQGVYPAVLCPAVRATRSVAHIYESRVKFKTETRGSRQVCETYTDTLGYLSLSPFSLSHTHPFHSHV